MNVWAYCCQSFVRTARQASDVEPLTCPPMRAVDFDPLWLAGPEPDTHWNVIYFDLHGEPGVPMWFGDDGEIALTAEQVHSVNLRGAVVFAVNCHLADDDSPMLDALLAAGASYVVGGPGPNYGGQRVQMGAPLLGQWFIRYLKLGFDVLDALRIAKINVRLQQVSATLQNSITGGAQGVIDAAEDTMEFRAFYRPGSNLFQAQ